MRPLFTLMSRQHGVASTRRPERSACRGRVERRLLADGVLTQPCPGVLAAAGRRSRSMGGRWPPPCRGRRRHQPWRGGPAAWSRRLRPPRHGRRPRHERRQPVPPTRRDGPPDARRARPTRRGGRRDPDAHRAGHAGPARTERRDRPHGPGPRQRAPDRRDGRRARGRGHGVAPPWPGRPASPVDAARRAGPTAQHRDARASQGADGTPAGGDTGSTGASISSAADHGSRSRPAPAP